MTVLKNFRTFRSIQRSAARRHGGVEALSQKMPPLPNHRAVAKISDDRWLSEMTKRVFQAGFNWDLIEQRWASFERAFEGFDPERWSSMSSEDLERLMVNETIVRNASKIRSVRVNASLLCKFAATHGTASTAIAAWPSNDFASLLNTLQKEGARLGGLTAQWLLRGMGKDGFVLTKDVTTALIREDIVSKAPSSQRDLRAIQHAFNEWRDQSGLPLSHISLTLACTVASVRTQQ